MSKYRLLFKILLNFIKHPLRSLKFLSPRKMRNFFYFLKEEGTAFVTNRMEESMQGIAIPKTTSHVFETSPHKMFHEYKCLKFPSSCTPLVSIIIPAFNQFPYTYNCLQSILTNSGSSYPFQVIVADDCSMDDTLRLEEITENILYLRNKKQLGFLKTCNHAASFAKGKYFLFLNNDTQVQENWLSPLVQLMETRSDVGMCGSKLIYANGTLQEAGGIVWKDASARNYGNGFSPESPEYNYCKEVDYISGASILIRSNLWNAFGGFDEQFSPAYYEDVDLAYRVRQKGYKVVYQPASVVVHFEGISNGTDISSGEKKYQAINQHKFYEKWKNILHEENFFNTEQLFLARDRSRNKKHLLVVDHYVPQYDHDAGSRCMLHYLELFINIGYHVTFIGDNFLKSEPYTSHIQQLGIEVLYGDYYYKNWKDWLRMNGKNYDYVLLCRPHISIKYIDFIRKVSNAKVLYLGYDLHYLREMRAYILTGNKKALKDSNRWKKLEFKLMKKADISYVFSPIEYEEIVSFYPEIKVRQIPLHIYNYFPKTDYAPDCRKDIVFVGGFGHSPNLDAVKWLCHDILPLVWLQRPDIKLHIVGSQPPNDVKNLANDHIIVHGFLSDHELEDLYQTIKISVVPLRYGAGIKGKIIESMVRGIPVITTSIGIEGINGTEHIVKIGDTPDVFGKHITNLYGDTTALIDMSKKEIDYIKANYSVEHALAVLRNDFIF